MNTFFKKYEQLTKDRAVTFKLALGMLLDLDSKNIVETGTVRNTSLGFGGNWSGDGCSTILFGDFAKTFGSKVWTCDINAEAIEGCKTVTTKYKDYITYIAEDSISFLQNFSEQIDFLYLDSHDGDLPGHAEHQLAEIKAAENKLHNKSIILLDDIETKPRLSMPYLLTKEWTILMKTNKQVLLIHG